MPDQRVTDNAAPCYDVLAPGDFHPETTIVRYDSTTRPTTPVLDRLIESEWLARTAEARQSGRQLYNGELFRYIHHRVEAAGDNRSSQRLHLTVGPTCYRDFVGTNFFNPHRVLEFGWECFSNAIGTTATLVTADGHIVYGRRSDRVAYHAGFLHTFGGTLEAADRQPDDRIDPFQSVAREITEEVAIQPAEMSQPVCVALVRDRHIVQPEMLFEVEVHLSAEQVVARWQMAEGKDEHAELFVLPDRAEAIRRLLECGERIAPVAIAALEFRRARLLSTGGPAPTTAR